MKNGGKHQASIRETRPKVLEETVAKRPKPKSLHLKKGDLEEMDGIEHKGLPDGVDEKFAKSSVAGFGNRNT